MPYCTSSAVLFLIFNRPDTAELVFEKIREAQPARLYLAADGPRKARVGEAELVAQTRKLAERVDWPCQIKTLFRDTNLGCKYAVSQAITWFFEHEEEGIILEDDCLPANDFFRFCDELLEKYRSDTLVTQVAGCNFQEGQKRGEASYYFSSSLEVWGWATWRRVWKMYDVNLQDYNEDQVTRAIDEVFGEPLVTEAYRDIFRQLKEGKIDTWDYQLKFLNFIHKGLCIIPNVNLISNIGFRPDATHTVTPNGKFENLQVRALDWPLTHPLHTSPNKEADAFMLNLEFNLNEKKRKGMSIFRRFKHWISS